MEETLKNLMLNYHQYAYIILFFWCIMEGELALILGGILAHEGHVDVALAIFVAGIGAFVGDQIYFYLGRYNKKYIAKKLVAQRRKFAIAHIMLKKYGWPIIFIQRYMYGFRVIIPMSIGLTRYSAKKYAFINLISGWCWAAITILLAWVFGQAIWDTINIIEAHWYVAIPLIGAFLAALFFGFRSIENKILKERKNRRDEISNNR
ncbi:DedA family protein [Campylobacter sp. RM9344]|uniref:DedA family protein n=1 Tax=Campylobacter californiensis TaxID=1032243 RepID=A0AAW3ZT08_9BACT|nr:MULTISPECIES: DedA family protein [unclassified Campylobacter]MBE2984838.1 DedA family protein [Campylobacter sp. RM6883]MBE2986542.1 DedA family protein [Campylobacter sp. RM12919]MBE2987742.1 DedA family protein [Campylobacter sp. RM12920]MBE2994696.1 DedA family protein [Campylobacter sp. RM6913]MBE3029562.1 DedA family protein [Campylobacter sp. RM9344]